MPPDRASAENPVDECLSPEQLVVANIKALMKARGVGKAELARRLNDLGFTTWRHEKTLRNLFDRKRSIRVDELFGFAAALMTSVWELLSPFTQWDVYDDPAASDFEIRLGPTIRRKQYLILLSGDNITPGIPETHVNWASWEPGETPKWTKPRQRDVEWLVERYRQLDWDLPAPAEELTADHLDEMDARFAERISWKDFE